MIPRDTVAIEMNSQELNSNTISYLSSVADRIQQLSLRDKGFGKLEAGNFISSIDHDVKERHKNGDKTANITVLYDQQLPPEEGEARIPSAVIVHEELSEQQIQGLREKLPEGVPILDGETNQLLDQVGQAEREEGRKKARRVFYMGSAAARMSVAPLTDGYLYSRLNSDGSYGQNNEQTRRYTAGTGFDDASADSFSSSKTPPSQEVRDHESKAKSEAEQRAEMENLAYLENDMRNITHATDEILSTAKDMYDADNLSGLDDDKLRRVQRKVQSKLHPDRGYENGGDLGAFQAANTLMDKVKESRSSPS